MHGLVISVQLPMIWWIIYKTFFIDLKQWNSHIRQCGDQVVGNTNTETKTIEHYT